MPPRPGAGGREIRGVVSDLDGTLLRSDGSLSPATVVMLGKLADAGHPFVVATARTPRGVRKLVGHELLGRVVCANGAVLWDARSDEVIHESCFDPVVLAGAVDCLRGLLPAAGVALLSSRVMFVDDAYRRLKGNLPLGSALFSDPEPVVSRHAIVMVAVRHRRLVAEELVVPTAEAFEGLAVASFAGPGVVDVVPAPATKAVGVARSMVAAGCPPEEIVAFGDMPNDLPMLAWAGRSCAMANGHPTVLQAVDEVVPSNDADGVARTVGRLLGL